MTPPSGSVVPLVLVPEYLQVMSGPTKLNFYELFKEFFLETYFIQAGSPSCHPVNCIIALTGKVLLLIFGPGRVPKRYNGCCTSSYRGCFYPFSINA